MCGIVGICSKNSISRREWLTTGRDAMRHRGPDDYGQYWSPDGLVGLAHRRLSIIDLSPSGKQPMHDHHNYIIFNGEIYNYQQLKVELEDLGHVFFSTSDTEVILVAYRQWGKKCLERLHGAFAFAIYDPRQAQVFLARDRSGEKPLFYKIGDGELSFASELKALMADPTFIRRINRKALDCYLTLAYIPGDLCILEGVNKLPPAHAMTFSLSDASINIWRYWELPDLISNACEYSDEEQIEELESLLESSVKRQLVADVPIGVLLSGGIDSSLITALAARNVGRLKTFTVGFKDYLDFDESKHAELIAKYYDTDHTLLEANYVTPDIMLELAKQFDEPMVDSSMIPTFLVSQQIGQYCKVALGGDGGDELFGGYYSASRMAELQLSYNRVPHFMKRLGSKFALSLMPIGAKRRHFLTHLGIDIDKDIPIFMPQFDYLDRRRILANYSDDWPFVAEDIRQDRIPITIDPVQRVTRFDFQNYMVEDILVKVDRASMINSLEIRAPFLDVSLIEFAFSRVPSSLKASPNNRKIILKKLAADILPSTFDYNRKMGFGIPLNYWLKDGPWRQFFEDVLLAPDAIFSRREVMNLFKGLDKGRKVKEHLFGLTLFELWRREYNVVL